MLLSLVKLGGLVSHNMHGGHTKEVEYLGDIIDPTTLSPEVIGRYGDVSSFYMDLVNICRITTELRESFRKRFNTQSRIVRPDTWYLMQITPEQAAHVVVVYSHCNWLLNNFGLGDWIKSQTHAEVKAILHTAIDVSISNFSEMYDLMNSARKVNEYITQDAKRVLELYTANVGQLMRFKREM